MVVSHFSIACTDNNREWVLVSERARPENPTRGRDRPSLPYLGSKGMAEVEHVLEAVRRLLVARLEEEHGAHLVVHEWVRCVEVLGRLRTKKRTQGVVGKRIPKRWWWWW